jgi:signal-transduction protein with cAMP-binding, CBS, and nucleotidyltransferase domain
MRRFRETHDLKRLHRIQVRLMCLETDIKLLKEAAEAAKMNTKAIFRKSYAFEAYLVMLANRIKHNYLGVKG